MKSASDKISREELVALFDIPELVELRALIQEAEGRAFVDAHYAALDKGASESKAEEAGYKAELRVGKRATEAYQKALEEAVYSSFNSVGLRLEAGKSARSRTYTVKPKKDWDTAAKKVLAVLNRVGFEIDSVGEWMDRDDFRTPREAVLLTLAWLRYAHVVHDEPRPKDVFNRAFAYQLFG